MKFLYWLTLLFSFVAQAQPEEDGGSACRAGKIQSFGRLANDPKARIAYPGDATIDVTYYGLDLRLTHTPNYLRGAATLTLRSAGNVNSFFLDLRSTTATTGEGLRVDSVKAGAQRLAFGHIDNRLTIIPAQSLTNGQILTLTVYYQGVPNSSTGSFRFGRHESTTDPVIWSLSEPYGAPDWFPCKDSPADKADSSAVRITADKRFVSVSNGVLERTTDNPDSTRTYQWRNRYPIAQYLISVAMTNYVRYDTPFMYGTQTMPVTHYLYPETLPQVRANLDLTPQMLRLFTERFGPYPFLREKYGHAQFGYGNGGMEHQTISSMESRAFSPAIIAHELAHQWFGDKITCRDWQNIWLNEGFASYAEAVWAESTSGPMGYQNAIGTFMANARNAQGPIYVQNISSVNTIFNGSRTYAKGATVLHMLRGIVGDSTFYRILRTYTATPTLAYGTAVTEDFQAVAQQVSGQNLDYFFQQWIRGEGFPIYRVTYAGTGTSATVRIEQRNNASGSTNPQFFTMPITLTVRSAAGDTTVRVFNDRADQTVTLPARGTVTGVLVDPNNWILKTVETISATAGLVLTTEPTAAVNLSVYPNPTVETLTLDVTTTAAGPLTVTLVNAAGQRVRTLTEPVLPAGKHTRMLNLRGLPTGRYVVTVDVTSGRQSRVVLVR